MHENTQLPWQDLIYSIQQTLPEMRMLDDTQAQCDLSRCLDSGCKLVQEIELHLKILLDKACFALVEYSIHIQWFLYRFQYLRKMRNQADTQIRPQGQRHS